MSSLTSQILPTLDAFGFWSYWIIGLSSLLEGWWLTSVIVPGTLVVDAGGALVRLGHMDFIDLAWFVGIGAILGGELSWHSPARDAVLWLWNAGRDETNARVVGWAFDGAETPAHRPAETLALSLVGAPGGQSLAVGPTGKVVRLTDLPPNPIPR